MIKGFMHALLLLSFAGNTACVLILLVVASPALESSVRKLLLDAVCEIGLLVILLSSIATVYGFYRPLGSRSRFLNPKWLLLIGFFVLFLGGFFLTD